MRWHDYDGEGWYVGWHDAEAPRANCTDVSPTMPHSRARWNGSAWIIDTARELQREQDEQAERNRMQAAVDKCKAYDPATATAAEVRATLGASLYLLRRVIQELRP
jgi:hypothetical protein